MDFIFSKYNVRISIPNSSKLYKKDDVLKMLNLKKEQAQNCLLAVGDDTVPLTIINYLYDVKDNEELMAFINQYISINNNNGFKLNNHTIVNSTDGRQLNMLKFINKQNVLIVIISCINNHLFSASTNCLEDNSKYALNFVANLMKTLCPSF